MAPAKSKVAPRSGKRSAAQESPAELAPSEKNTRVSKKAKPNSDVSPSEKAASLRLQAAMDSQDIVVLTSAVKAAKKAGVPSENVEQAQAMLDVLAPQVLPPTGFSPSTVTTIWAPISAAVVAPSSSDAFAFASPIVASPSSSRRDASPAALATSASPGATKLPPPQSHSDGGTPRAQKGSASLGVDDLSQAFAGFEGILAASVRDAEQRVASAAERKAELDCVAVEVAATLQTGDTKDENNDGCETLRASVESATAAAVVSSSQLEKIAAERAKWVEEKQACEQAVEKHFAIVRDGATIFVNGAFERSTDSKHVAALEPVFRRIGFEESLIEAFPSAASRMPGARTDFMHTVISQVDTLIAEHIAALDSKLSASDAALAQREAAAADAREAVAAAEAVLSATTEGASAARAARIGAEAADRLKSDAAAAAASAAGLALPALEAELELARRRAAAFASGPARALGAWRAQHLSEVETLPSL